MAEPEEEVLSLQEVLEEDQQLEQIANAVLGDSDDSHCTYPKGYVQRQAVYACATCTPPAGDLAGLCLACSLHCHDGHQLHELYTKRHFRCDCGNSKYLDFTCTLCPDKDPVNTENRYNHNFQGLYCTCGRPYPDSEDEVEDEMIQCVVCEDWFHSRHVGGTVPSSYEDMACDACMRSHDFLRVYQLRTQPVTVRKEEGGGRVNVMGDEKPQAADVDPDTSCGSDKKETEGSGKAAGVDRDLQESSGGGGGCEVSSGGGGGRDVSSGGWEVTTVEGGREGGGCELLRRRAMLGSSGQEGTGAGFFAGGWRAQLCKCTTCVPLYASLGVSHLLSEEDSVAAYEGRGQTQPSSHDAAMAALSSVLDRTQQVEVIHGYSELKSELTDFLQGFAAGNKVVSRRDIEGFFEGMQARKRRRLETGQGVPPAHCHY